jgi:hypothetical protein
MRFDIWGEMAASKAKWKGLGDAYAQCSSYPIPLFLRSLRAARTWRRGHLIRSYMIYVPS